MDLVQFFTILFVLYLSGVDCLMFHLEPMAKKCLKEEIHKDVLSRAITRSLRAATRKPI